MKETLQSLWTLEEQPESLTILHKGARCYTRSLKKAFHGLIHPQSHTRIDQSAGIARTSLLHPAQQQRLKSKIYVVDYYIDGHQEVD
ncbi:hypothetical protein [Dictyobacter aurantiacus]|uniref:Uncharacterized protein n=1 Tax=Dictyobacter aurantiacus TaxID=1936993 RepID=A0A401ZS56_9CHLR|nr:hypothetical protein [Dictyobacter aurantiacus]GCE09624.1 hypothetical protein KDAU_69530 [Dictyobacter aurantiacus]